MEKVNHPPHYGGDTTYETIKVIEAWGLNFHLGNAVKYISRSGRKGSEREDLQKALWYIQRHLDCVSGASPDSSLSGEPKVEEIGRLIAHLDAAQRATET